MGYKTIGPILVETEIPQPQGIYRLQHIDPGDRKNVVKRDYIRQVVIDTRMKGNRANCPQARITGV